MNNSLRSAFTMTPVFRRFMLTVHVIVSVGWLGAVVVFLVLAVRGLISQDIGIVRAVYNVLALIGWWVIVPACIGSLLTGLILSLGSPWGLFKYYWVSVKLLITAVSTILLLAHMQLIGYMAKTASAGILSFTAFRPGGIQLVVEAGAAALALIAATAISVYKPWGKVPYWFPEKNEGNERAAGTRSKTGKRLDRYVVPVLIGLLLLFVILHLAGGGLHKH